jgi:hypothetical protein
MIHLGDFYQPAPDQTLPDALHAMMEVYALRHGYPPTTLLLHPNTALPVPFAGEVQIHCYGSPLAFGLNGGVWNGA